MKLNSIFLLSLLCIGNSFSQDYITEELVIPFEWHPEAMSWQLIDENYSIDNVLDGRWDHIAELPNSQAETFCRIFPISGNAVLLPGME
jgi:hypothetical protein